MIEEHVRFSAGAGRGLDADFTRDEPSHIHLPRRRRTVRLDDRGHIVGRGVGDEDRAQATER